MLKIADLSILLIEPSITQLKFIQRTLLNAGVDQVSGVSSGYEGLAAMSSYPPDLVVSAMYLPDMTATDLVLKMRESTELRHVPFMLVSSETDFHALDPIRQAGVVAVLPKPFGLDELQRALRSTIQLLEPHELELHDVDLGSLSVLVVDDSSLARNHMKRVLTDMGIGEVKLACDGREGTQVFQQHAFDLVVTDLNMPEMDGKELTEYIRKNLNNKEVPILMVTSEQDMTRLANVEQAGVSAICDKPFDPQSVREILARVLIEIAQQQR